MTAICNHVGSDCGYSIRNGPHCDICAILSLQPARTYGGGWDHIRLRLRQWVIRKDSNERCMHRFRRGGEPSSCHSCVNGFPLGPSMEVTLQVCSLPTKTSMAWSPLSGHGLLIACLQDTRNEIQAPSPQPAHKKVAQSWVSGCPREPQKKYTQQVRSLRTKMGGVGPTVGSTCSWWG